MKKVVKKKKFKGTRYVAKVLSKYFKKKYPNYTAALPKARELTEQFKASGQKFTVKNVEYATRSRRVKPLPTIPEPEPTEKPPLLFYSLQKAHYFFELPNFPTYINDTTKEVTFVSDIFNEGIFEIQGGQSPSYTKVFSAFVNYVNKKITDRKQGYQFQVITLPPEFNKQTNRWEARIVSIDAKGIEDDFGYEPGAGTPTDEKPIKPIKKTPTPEAPSPKSEELTKLETELKLSKETSRQQANQMFLKGLINKKEYKDEIERINNL
jgi:hypothetical protein